MLRIVKEKSEMSVERPLAENGANVILNVGIERYTEDGFVKMPGLYFNNVLEAKETKPLNLGVGIYQVKVSIHVIEGVTGKFDWYYSVGGKLTGKGSGDVNISPKPNDSREYALDTFALRVDK